MRSEKILFSSKLITNLLLTFSGDIMKKYYTLLILILFCCTLVYPQSVLSDATDNQPGITFPTFPVKWSPITDAAGDWCPAGMFPDVPVPTFFQAAAWLGDTLYVHTPNGSVPTDAIYKYTYGGTWSAGTPLPVALTGGTLTECNGNLYYFGGGTASITTGSTSAYSYSPSTGAWTSVAPMPVALSAHGTVCWGDSVLFVLGGPYTGSGTNLNVYYYRVASDTWGTITNSLPTGMGRRTFACGLVGGNTIMMGAGYNTSYLKSVLIGTIGSDASQITWTMGPDVPTTYAGLSRPGGTGIFNYFFVVCGERSGGGYHDTTYVFDITLNSWIDVIAPKPFPTSNIFNAVTSTAWDDSVRLFVPGGYAGSAFANFDVVACGDLLVIPVELSAFGANVNNGTVILNWSTTTETNNQGFEIQRNSGNGFEVLAFIRGNGTSTEVHNYSYADRNVIPGIYSYRLRQVDFDGTAKYSKTIEVKVEIPGVYSLEQNYPNPFNPSTQINFNLAADSKVTLKVFNLLGQEVVTLLNENMTAGVHNVTFNAANLPSGVYIYKMGATAENGNNFTAVRKMILTK
jgi:N-acetylneuraminic acid mutarotase